MPSLQQVGSCSHPGRLIPVLAALHCCSFQRYDLSSLRTGIMAGSPCPVAVMRKVQRGRQAPLLGMASTYINIALGIPGWHGSPAFTPVTACLLVWATQQPRAVVALCGRRVCNEPVTPSAVLGSCRQPALAGAQGRCARLPQCRDAHEGRDHLLRYD